VPKGELLGIAAAAFSVYMPCLSSVTASTCSLSESFTQPLLPSLSVTAPSVWNSLPSDICACHFVVILKLAVSSRPSVPPSGSHKCLRLSILLTLFTLKDFIYLLIICLLFSIFLSCLSSLFKGSAFA